MFKACKLTGTLENILLNIEWQRSSIDLVPPMVHWVFCHELSSRVSFVLDRGCQVVFSQSLPVSCCSLIYVIAIII